MSQQSFDKHSALAVPTRRRLLETLQGADEPLDVAQLAAVVGLHVTTARFHLARLEEVGLIRSLPDREGRPGRPRRVYLAATDAGGEGQAEARNRQLAGALAAALDAEGDVGRRMAEATGARWAEALVESERSLSWEAGTEAVHDLFDQLGFAPRLNDTPDQRLVELHACPFREVARAYPTVVCSVHRGLMRASLDRLGLPAEARGAELQPFVEPDLCVAMLPRPARGGSGAGR